MIASIADRGSLLTRLGGKESTGFLGSFILSTCTVESEAKLTHVLQLR